MGLKKDFLIHKKKTVESFRFVRADISSININIDNLKSMLASMELRISALDNKVTVLRKEIDKCLSDINAQQDNYLNIHSKTEHIIKSISDVATAATSFKSSINKIVSNNKQILKDISSNRSAIKKLFLISKTQSLKNNQVNSELRKSKAEIKKLKNSINKRPKR